MTEPAGIFHFSWYTNLFSFGDSSSHLHVRCECRFVCIRFSYWYLKIRIAFPEMCDCRGDTVTQTCDTVTRYVCTCVYTPQTLKLTVDCTALRNLCVAPNLGRNYPPPRGIICYCLEGLIALPLSDRRGTFRIWWYRRLIGSGLSVFCPNSEIKLLIWRHITGELTVKILYLVE